MIGGATEAVERAIAACDTAGFRAVRLPVSHAFHTEIVAPASEPLRATLERLRLSPPSTPVVANVSGDFYPMGPDAVPEMLDILARQVASPVQFLRGLRTLFDAGARVFVEVGPKRALQGFAADVLGDEPDVLDLCTNLAGKDDATIFNQALCGLYAAGLGTGRDLHQAPHPEPETGLSEAAAPVRRRRRSAPVTPSSRRAAICPTLRTSSSATCSPTSSTRAEAWSTAPRREPATTEPVVITGAALGLPGTDWVFDDENVARLLHGTQLIDVIPSRLRHEIVEKHVTRLVKRETGEPTFETIDDPSEVIKLAARAGKFDLAQEFGVPAERAAAFGRDTELAIAAGIDALRDAGIPLVMRYKTTTTGTLLPERWGLPDALRDDTGVIFASAFPGLDAFADELARFWADHGRHDRLADLESLRARFVETDGQGNAVAEVDRRIHDLRHELDEHGFTFDRRFLFRILSMGHSQFAELVGARGPNTQVNAACASTTQAVAIAEDWIRAGRCRRVVIVAADDVTSDHLLGWIGTGFLASGAAATDEVVEEAALPFDQRRHGMILGMGAAALVVERADAARERGIAPICEVLGSVTANSAFHGTRLDVEHIGAVMEAVVQQAEARGVRRHDLAPATVFISHETYTPARGGSASAEVHALREVFGADADRVVVANTKGFTGHPMGVGIEDVVAVKALETGIVPPVANYKEVDPELGPLNLSKGGAYPVEYALRLAAGFGSQISMMLLHRTPVPDGRRQAVDELGYEYRIVDRGAWAAWLRRATGSDAPELEVVDRRLRVVDRGPGEQPARPTAAPVEEPTPAPAPTETMPVTTEAAPAPAEAAPAITGAAPAAAGPDGADPVLVRVLELVAATTGYPPDMLDADLDLEADLGIDTVKQAEIFASIRESYGIERDENLKLRDYPTLAHVVAFVHEHAPQTTAPARSRTRDHRGRDPRPRWPDGADPVLVRVLELVAATTGYPPDMLDADLDLEADLGIDTVKQAEIFASIRESYGIERDENLKLRDYPTLAHVVAFVHERAPQTTRARRSRTGDHRGRTRDHGAEPGAFTRRVPGRGAAPAAGLVRAHRRHTGPREPGRRDARPGRRRRCARRAPGEARRGGARARGRPDSRRARIPARKLGEPRRGARGVLARGARRPRRRSRPRGLARGPARAREAARGHHACPCRSRARRGDVPRERDAARRAPRL